MSNRRPAITATVLRLSVRVAVFFFLGCTLAAAAINTQQGGPIGITALLTLPTWVLILMATWADRNQH